MKFAFVTCVQVGLSCMESIYEAGGKLDLVITLKDDLASKKSGRIYVNDFCERKHIDVLKIRNINDDDAVNALKRYDIDWLFIIGWSQIACAAILSTPKQGVVGMHPTLLPIGRGRAAIPWALLMGLPQTGVTMFKLDGGVDTGPIIAQEVIPIMAEETATTLYDKVAVAHKILMHRMWNNFTANRIILTPQDNFKATEWPGRTPSDGIILPDMTVKEAGRLVRATTHPYPGAYWNEGTKKIIIWSGKVGNGMHAPPEGAVRLNLKDGVFDVLDYEVE